MTQPAVPDPFGAAFDGYVDAVRHWRHWLGTVIAVLAPAEVLAFLLPAVASAGDAAIVNGRLVPTDSAVRWAEVTLTANGSRVAVPLVLLAGWAVALVLCLRVFAGPNARLVTAASWPSGSRVACGQSASRSRWRWPSSRAYSCWPHRP